MKKMLLLVLVLSAAGWGQTAASAPPQKGQRTNLNIGNSPTAADMYCSGYITPDKVPTDHYVAAGWNSPDQTRFAALADRVYLHGPNMKEGDRFAIIRHVKDPNHYQFYRGQRSAVRNAGEPYFEMGYVKVIDVQKNIAVAIPELACGDFVIGDLAVPFAERPVPLFRSVSLDRFSPPSGKTQGRIIMANEFDAMAGSKSAVYLNLGSDKGVKVGDYFKATRTYTSSYNDPEAGLSRKASANETQQVHPEKFRDISTLPRRTLGDMIILNVNRKSSTALVLTAYEDIHVGDGVELMDVSAAPEVQPVRPASTTQPTSSSSPGTQPPPGDTSAASPPKITCSAAPPSVRMGESSTISCDATSPDNRQLAITFVANGGKLSSSRNQAHLDTTDAGAGPISVRATAFDDRQLSATAVTTVNVEAPVSAKPVAQKMTDLEFKPMSAYVDNRSKAILDDVALKLQQDPNSNAVLTGAADEKEPSRLATQRAENAKTYLTKSKGIDAARLQTKPSSTPGRIVEIWTVPPGATPPQ